MSEPTLRQEFHSAIAVLEEAQRALVEAEAARDAARDRVYELIHKACPL